MADPVIPEQVKETSATTQESILEANHKKQHDLRVLAGTLITSEQSLINNRMTWMMTFQGLLFASFALTASSTNDPAIKTIIIDVVPYAGLLVALVTLLGITAAFLSITHIKNSLRVKVAALGVDIEDGIIPYGTKLASYMGRTTAYLFPIIIAITWFTIARRVHKVKVIEKAEESSVSTVSIDPDTTNTKLNGLRSKP